ILYVHPFYVTSSVMSCLLVIRILPISTLFPYTTLFRSPEAVPVPAGAWRGGRHHGLLSQCRLFRPVPATRARRNRGPEARHVKPDRKSTRLNSSHVKISYAVFCLKKKTK